MWIALTDGFISVVEADMKRLPKRERCNDRGTGMLTIRARNPAHLKALFPDRRIYSWKARDYPARIFIAREDFAAFIAKRAASISYGNFKAAVPDNELHDAYSAVWGVMHGYQYGRFRRQPYDPRQRDFVWGRGSPVRGYGATHLFSDEAHLIDDDELDDEVPCTTPGCTEDHPCMNCLIDAINGQRDKGGPDRAGPYDEDDDDLAASHLRVPPR
jgi:hypothetical protein